MSDILIPKGPGMQGPKEVVMDRLRRRMTGYRKHHDDCGPRFEHTVNGLNDRQKQETFTLRQRFMESKSKKSAKKSDKSKQEGSNSSGASKLQKRHSEDSDMNAGSECYEPPKKITASGNVNDNTASNSTTGSFEYHQSHSQTPNNMKSTFPAVNCKNESLNKVPLEITQQVEIPTRTGSLRNTKGLTHSSLKLGSGSAATTTQIAGPISDHRAMGVVGPNSSYPSPINPNTEFKTEPNSAFVDLDQCAAALEKDASIMSALIGDVSSEEMINYDTLKDLISEISHNPDFMKDFDDFDDDHSGCKNLPVGLSTIPTHLHSTNPCAENNPSFSGHGLSRTPPVAPVTPATSSPRLSQVKMESESNNSGHTTDSVCGNGGLSHCAGPSPAVASTASPLASQLNSHHPSQTPPYNSGSAMFDSASPTGAQGQTNPLTPSSSSNYCPTSNTSTHSTIVSASGINTKGARVPYTSPSSLALDSPAAQTLKQMAEQHQHKTQLGMSTFKSNPGSNSSPARSPFNGESYAGFSGSGEFTNTSNMGASNSSSSSNYSNVSVRAQSGGISSVSDVGDNLTMAMPIKPEKGMYSPQSNLPTMDIKRKNVNPNHIPQQTVPTPSQTQLKIAVSNPSRLSNSAILQSQQPSPLYSNKSFTHANPSGNQLGPNTSANPMTNNSHIQPFMNRPPNPGLSSAPPNNYSPSSHSGYQENTSLSTVQMKSTQLPIPRTNSASLPISTSGSQQWELNGDPKNTIPATTQPQIFYYRNQGISPHSHIQTTNNIHSHGGNQDQTINFTQQHLRLSTGVTTGLSRMVCSVPGSPVPGNGSLTRMNLLPRMANQPCPGSSMNDLSMTSRMEIQRMIRQQQVRMQHEQGAMMHPGSEEMSTHQIIGGQNSAMNRFSFLIGNPSANSASSRPGSGTMTGGGPGHPNMSNLRMQKSMFGSRHGTSPVGSSNTFPMGGNISMNSMNTPIRRMPSFGPIDGGPNCTTTMPAIPGEGGSMNVMIPSESQQQSMALSSDWTGMSDSNVRNYPGTNLQQQLRQAIRPNTNSSNFHPAMTVQMVQPQPGMSHLQHAEATMCGIGIPVHASGQSGIGGNPMGNMGYGQQQQIPGVNPGNFSQSPTVGNKMSQSLPNMCVSSNFTMKTGGGMALNTSTGSGGVMMCANAQSVNQMSNPGKTNAELTNQDFTFELLENITSNDPSTFNEDSDFLSTFDSNPNYMLDSL